MKMLMVNNILLVTITSLFLFSSNVHAEQSLHLLFHMGVGLNGEFYIGGTLENKGETDVYAGFIVVTPFDKNCHPKNPLFLPISEPIKSGYKQEFRIPVEGELYAYEISALHAMDSLSRKIAVIDDTAIIMEGKKNKHLQRCLQARKNN